MASIWQSQIDIIRGWSDSMGPKDVGWKTEYCPFHTVLTAIVECLEELALRAEVDISSDITSLQSSTFGPTIRSNLYNVCNKVAAAYNKWSIPELFKIKTAHYGRDLRDPIADLFIKLGLLEDHYDPTTDNDYICDNADVLYYIGNKRSPIIPAEIDGVQIVTLTTSSFQGSNIQGVSIPEGVEVIE